MEYIQHRHYKQRHNKIRTEHKMSTRFDYGRKVRRRALDLTMAAK